MPQRPSLPRPAFELRGVRFLAALALGVLPADSLKVRLLRLMEPNQSALPARELPPRAPLPGAAPPSWAIPGLPLQGAAPGLPGDPPVLSPEAALPSRAIPR